MNHYYIAGVPGSTITKIAYSKSELVASIAESYSIDDNRVARIKFPGLKEIKGQYGESFTKQEALKDFLISNFNVLYEIGYCIGRSDRV